MRREDALNLLKNMENIAMEAGNLACDMLKGDLDIQYKGENDPVTAIDYAVNDLLHKRLLGIRPTYGWLSEETQEDPTWLDKPAAWVVDPIDGTQNMIRGDKEFAVSIALVEQGQPALAVVYTPVYQGTKSDMISGGRYGIGLRHNGKPFTPAPRPLATAPRLVVAYENRVSKYFRDAGYEIVQHGSIAYRLANVGLGRADVALGLKHASNPWDVAAGHLLAELGGCPMTELAGTPIHYDKPGQRYDGFIAAPESMRTALQGMVMTLRTQHQKEKGHDPHPAR